MFSVGSLRKARDWRKRTIQADSSSPESSSTSMRPEFSSWVRISSRSRSMNSNRQVVLVLAVLGRGMSVSMASGSGVLPRARSWRGLGWPAVCRVMVPESR